jgi:transposase
MELLEHGLMAMERELFVAAPKKYPDELRARAVRLYRESNPKPVVRRLAEQLGVHHEALRNWIRQAEADAGERHDRPTSEMLEENRRLVRENAELRRANEILKAASAYFAAELDPTRRRS